MSMINNMFHKHNFTPIKQTDIVDMIQVNENRLYCSCGETKCIHHYRDIEKMSKVSMHETVRSIIYVQKCDYCGIYNNHEVNV